MGRTDFTSFLKESWETSGRGEFRRLLSRVAEQSSTYK